MAFGFSLANKNKEERREILLRETAKPMFLAVNEMTSEELDDKELVLGVVSSFGRNLSKVSDRLRADPEVVWKAVRQNVVAIGGALGDIRLDRELNLFVAKNQDILIYVADEVKEKDWFLKEWLKHNPNNWFNSVPRSKDTLLNIVKEADDDYRVTMLNNIKSQPEHFWNLGAPVFKEAIQCTSDENLLKVTPADEIPMMEWINNKIYASIKLQSQDKSKKKHLRKTFKS